MSCVTTFLLLICFNVGLSYGMQCSIGNRNFLSRMIDSCPGFLYPEEKSYCCYDIEKSEMYCCDATEFFLKSSWILLTVIAVVIIVFSLIVFCVSCLCCTCCPWYRRRHRGTVYGKVQVPSVVVIPQPNQQYTNPACPTSSMGITQQPPAYTNVIYEKQAPYNPNYVSSIHQ